MSALNQFNQFGRRQPMSQTNEAFKDNVCPFFSWKHYFPFEDFASSPTLAEKISFAMEFFLRCKTCSHAFEAFTKKTGNFSLDFRVLSSDVILASLWPQLAQELYDDPEITLAIFSLAMHQVLLDKIKIRFSTKSVWKSNQFASPPLEIPYQLRARLGHYDKFVDFRNIRAGLYGKLVVIRGNVIRAGPILAMCHSLTFTCRTCLGVFSHLQPDGIFTQPSRCSMYTGNRMQCTGSSFQVLRRSSENIMLEFQTVRVQEDNATESNSQMDRIPRLIDCKLTGDLVGQCFVGQSVAFTGVIKAQQNAFEEKRSIAKENNIYSYYFQVVSIYHHREGNYDDEMSNGESESELEESQSSSFSSSSSSSTSSSLSPSSLTSSRESSGPFSYQIFSSKDYRAIRDIQGKHHIFSYLVSSLCPSIYGHLLIKAGLLLSLFGGNSQGEQKNNQSDPLRTRSNIHLLMIGDPGIGKSHLLRTCANISSRGVYVCGNTTTRSGLTISLVKDKENPNDYSLEAGALVLSDHGTCCLDEFDKMKKEHQSLLETMEQQTVSLAKSGVVCSLPARTSILAAANPCGGHYNRSKSLSENLKFSPALLSRFDLIYLLLDRPDTFRDKMLTDHVVGIRSNQKRKRARDPVEDHQRFGFRSMNRRSELSEPHFHSSYHDTHHKKDLKSRLEQYDATSINTLSISQLRKYIAYAREYVHPILEEDAKIELKNFYLSSRMSRHSGYTTPVNPRQLESLVRLAQARAKSELRENVTRDDALDVIEIVQRSLSQVLEVKQVQPTIPNFFGEILNPRPKIRKQSATKTSFQTEAKKFLEKLRIHVRETGDTQFHLRELFSIASGFGLGQDGNFNDIIDYINNLGYLIKKAGNVFQFKGK